MSTLLLKTRILPGGRIEVQSPGLPDGLEVTLRITVEDEATREQESLQGNPGGDGGGQFAHAKEDGSPKRRISDILANYPGGQLFKTAAEVDQYIKEERESWGD